ncbi:zinc finger protein 839 [Hypanus sabinus]|uniref:zinc finger protein 839 n=1 Tax=Hypanus sabinus TaxID=79690 RepID=UPI0028C47513|nr:zinc finger protein 839 [Hypanus sabinus]
MADEEENSLTTEDGAVTEPQHGNSRLESLAHQEAASHVPCASVPCKQFEVHSCQVLPEYVQVAVEEGATQVVSTLSDDGDGLLNATGILNSLGEAPPSVGTMAAVSAGDFAVAEELESISIESTPSTIIYVQPDGTFVEGTGLTPEEQQQLVEQLTKQQGLVEVSESEAAQMFGSQQQQQDHTQFVQHVGLTDELQHVIAHVTKSQQHAAHFGKTTAVHLNSEPPENRVLQKSSLTSCVAPETRELPTDQNQMIQVPVCNSLMPQVQTGVQSSQVVHRIDSCNPAQVQQITISTQSSTVNQPSQPKIPTAVSQQQAAYTQPLTIVHNAARQLQNAAHQAVLQQNLQQSIAHVQQKMAPLRVTSSAQHQLDTVQVHIQTVPSQEEKDRPMPPLAVVQPKTAASNQMANQRTTVSGGVNISGPQIIRIQPLSTTGSQQYILHSSSEPPIQLLVQRQPPPLAPVNSIRMIPGVTISSQSGIFTNTVTTTINATTTAVANTISTSHMKKQEVSDKSKEKKPVKIKTRSGRISRPPKYKVKDYKFIKTEDLAEGHQSDSDDYSEYSFEEEDVKTKIDDSSLSIPCSFKPKKFKCDTCEKSYIGRGGLARHYRLNPSHGELASVIEEQRTSVSKTNGDVIVGDTGGGGDRNGTIVDGLETQSVNTDTTSVMVGSTELSSQDVQQTGKVTLAHFPARRRTVKRGRPPKHHNNNYHQEQVMKRKARLKELLKQCDDEELMELALPRLTEVITLWEFLLMKVEKGHPARPQFQDVYREFEMLHKHVKKMAEEHLNNSIRLTNPQQPLQISSLQVAESLGITEHMNKENQQDASVSLTYKLVTVDDQNHVNSPVEKHVMEQDFEVLSPLSKRMKIDDSIAGTESNLNQNGIEITGEGHLQSLSNATDKKEVESPALNTCDPHTEYGSTAVQEVDNHTDGVLLSADIKSSSSMEQSTSEELCYQVTQVNLSNSQLPLLETHNEVLNNTIQGGDFLSMDTDLTAEELVQEQLSSQNISEQLNNAELTPTEDEMTNQNSLLSGMAKVSQKDSEAGNSVQELHHTINSQDPLGNQEQSEQLNDSDIADQMQQLEKALSQDVEPIGQVCHRQHHQTEQTFEAEISPQEVLNSQVSSEEMNGLQVANQSKIIGHFEEPNVDQRNHESSEDIIESTVTEDGALEFQLPVEGQELLAEGHEQIFIQTSEGLIVSHEGTAVVSQTSEGIVIVTNADGTTMHIRTPDGVPFETVEALLAMDSEGQSEGLLVPQTQTEVEQ